MCLFAFLPTSSPAQDDPRAPYDAALEDVVGAYRLPDGQPLVVRLAYGGGLVIRDLASGRLAVVKSVEEDRYASGDGLTLRFLRDAAGSVREARYTGPGGREAEAPRIPLVFEPVSFTSGDATLEGTLVLPATGGPHAAVVIQPGSSWILRESAESLETAITFAAHGIAGLAYDKRGYGDSGGETLVPFRTTAGDAAAAAETLVHRFDVNPDWIGIWGLSQGAWIAPLAARENDAIGFLVLVGAPGTSPARQEIQRVRARARAEGLPAEEVEAAGRFLELSFAYGGTGLGWDAYAAARRSAEGKPWLRWVWSPEEPGFDHFGWGRMNGHHNPLPALLELREPVLALWGEHDVNVNPEVHRSIFEVALDAAGNPDYTLLVVPEAEHVLQVAASSASGDAVDRIAPDVWPTVIEWVRARTDRGGRTYRFDSGAGLDRTESPPSPR